MALQTTIAGGPKLAAADLPQPESSGAASTVDEPAPVAPQRQFAMAVGAGDARQEAAATMLLLLVATARSKRDGGEAHRQAADAERPVSRQTADASHVR